jgi:Sec-independent protein translocase protein TatA
VGLGAEILFLLLLGLLVLGPKRLHTVLADAAQAKARFEEASRGFKSQLTAELEAASQGPGNREHSRFLATESRREPDGLVRGEYKMVEGSPVNHHPDSC